jgi:hypothetical protein
MGQDSTCRDAYGSVHKAMRSAVPFQPDGQPFGRGMQGGRGCM